MLLCTARLARMALLQLDGSRTVVDEGESDDALLVCFWALENIYIFLFF